jgi:glycosyltransferase involved in cell wall biosynthesis
MSSLVSIVIPTFKRAHAVRQAIISVKCQTWINWELIIVDDNDPESQARKDTQLVMAEFLSDPKIIYIEQEGNFGACKARNTGLEQAKGKYVAFLDDDDFWLESKLEKQVLQLEKTGADLCYSDMDLEYQGRKKYYKCLSSENLFIKLLTQGFGICTSALLITKESLLSINGFDDSLPSMQDYDLLLRIAERFECNYIPEALLTYQLADDGISCNPVNKANGHKAIIDKYKDKYIQLDLKSGLSRQYESLADFTLRCGHRATAIKYYFTAISYRLLNYRVVLKIVCGALFGKAPLETYLKTKQGLSSKKMQG